LAIFNANAELVGAPNDLMYLKQGEHLMKKGVFSPALTYLNQALLLNPESKVIKNERIPKSNNYNFNNIYKLSQF
jgi:hypothetical protein